MKHPFNKAFLAAAFFCAFSAYCPRIDSSEAREEVEDAALNQEGVYRKTGIYDSLTVKNLLVKNIIGNNGSPVVVSGGINATGSVTTNGSLVGTAGLPGPTGAAGAVGAAGAGGSFLGYGYAYSTATATAIAAGAIIPVSSGVSSGMVATGGGIQVGNSGTFYVEFYVQGTPAHNTTQMSAGIAVGGVLQSTTIYAGNVLPPGSSQCVVGYAIISAGVSQNITIVNTSERALMAGNDTITVTANANTTPGESIINTSLLVLQVA